MPGRRVPLEVDDVAVVVVALALEEMVEPHFVQRGGRRERRDVAADALFQLVGLHHHRQRIPPHQTLDAAFDLAAAGEGRLFWSGDGVDVGSVRGERLLDAFTAGVVAQLSKQLTDSNRAARLDHVVERLEPLTRFQRFELRRVFRCSVTHGSSMEFFGLERSTHERPRRRETAAHPDQLLKMGVTTVYSSLRSIWMKTVSPDIRVASGQTPHSCRNRAGHVISLMLIMRQSHRQRVEHAFGLPSHARTP